MKKALILDIETDGLAEDSNIVLIGCKDVITGREWTYNLQRENKAAVSYELGEIFNDYDILVGYNIKDFDLRIVHNFFGLDFRKKKIDLYYILKNKQGLLGAKFKNFKLRTVVETLGLEQLKGEINFKVFQKRMDEEETKKAIEYLIGDLRATHGLFRYLDKYFASFKDFLKEEDKEMYNHFACNTGTFVYKFLCHHLGIEEKYGEKIKTNYPGGYVMQPRVEYEEGRIYCFDFNSLYPHIMMMANLFKKKADGWDGGIFQLKGRYDQEEWGEVSRELSTLYKMRQKLKKAKDPKQYVLKIIINTIYGLTGNSVFVNFYDTNTAADCTKIGRELTKMARDKFEERGYKVLYCDTDSVYLRDTKEDKLELFKAKDEIVESLKRLFPFPQETFDMGVDYEIKRIAFFKKKLYMFQTDDNKVVVKGLPIIKDNATPLSYKVFEMYIKPDFIKTGKYKFEFRELKDWCYELLEKNISLIGKSFNLKSLDYYKNDCNIYYQLSKKYGDGIRVFIPNFKEGPGKSVQYIPIEEAGKLKITDISIRSSLQELDYFCSEPERLKEYIKKEAKIIRASENIQQKALEVFA